MQNQLKKIIKLAKKTGDRLIVFDQENEDLSYVIMPVENYERLVVKNSGVKGLTEDELLDKINRNIAIWKSEQDFDNQIDVNSIKEAVKEQFLNKSKKRNNINFLEKMDFFPEVPAFEEENELGDLPEELPEEPEEKHEEQKRKWTIPSNRKMNAEEIVDQDENTQYLEEITF